MLRRRPRRLSVTIGARHVEGMATFFAEIGWLVTTEDQLVRVETPGGAFGLRHEVAPPRLELALNLRDPLDAESVAALVEPAGGIVMDPLQETAWGCWGFSFNDPEGNTWELGSPWTVTATDLWYEAAGRLPDRRARGAAPTSLDGLSVAVLPAATMEYDRRQTGRLFFDEEQRWSGMRYRMNLRLSDELPPDAELRSASR
jgi:predicted enzyme related to lactoylglutathione lyase